MAQQTEGNAPLDYVLFLVMMGNIKQNWLFYLVLLNILVFGYIAYSLVHLWSVREYISQLLINPLTAIISLNIIVITSYTNLYKRLSYLLFLSTLVAGYFLYVLLHYGLSFAIPLYSLIYYGSTFGNPPFFLLSVIAAVSIIFYLKTGQVKAFVRVAANIFIYLLCAQYFISLLFSLLILLKMNG